MPRPVGTRVLDRFKLKELLASKRLENYGDAAELWNCSRSYVKQLTQGSRVGDAQALRLANLLGAEVDALFPRVSP